MDLNNLDLTFLVDKQSAIQVKNAVIDEMYSWDTLLSPTELDRYYLMIRQLNKIIDGLKGGNNEW
ncbi:MAG: hypothetical protein ACI3T9_04525 [Romboutsia timonensis]